MFKRSVATLRWTPIRLISRRSETMEPLPTRSAMNPIANAASQSPTRRWLTRLRHEKVPSPRAFAADAPHSHLHVEKPQWWLAASAKGESPALDANLKHANVIRNEFAADRLPIVALNPLSRVFFAPLSREVDLQVRAALSARGLRDPIVVNDAAARMLGMALLPGEVPISVWEFGSGRPLINVAQFLGLEDNDTLNDFLRSCPAPLAYTTGPSGVSGADTPHLPQQPEAAERTYLPQHSIFDGVRWVPLHPASPVSRFLERDRKERTQARRKMTEYDHDNGSVAAEGLGSTFPPDWITTMPAEVASVAFGFDAAASEGEGLVALQAKDIVPPFWIDVAAMNILFPTLPPWRTSLRQDGGASRDNTAARRGTRQEAASDISRPLHLSNEAKLHFERAKELSRAVWRYTRMRRTRAIGFNRTPEFRHRCIGGDLIVTPYSYTNYFSASQFEYHPLVAAARDRVTFTHKKGGSVSSHGYESESPSPSAVHHAGTQRLPTAEPTSSMDEHAIPDTATDPVLAADLADHRGSDDGDDVFAEFEDSLWLRDDGHDSPTAFSVAARSVPDTATDPALAADHKDEVSAAIEDSLWQTHDAAAASFGTN